MAATGPSGATALAARLPDGVRLACVPLARWEALADDASTLSALDAATLERAAAFTSGTARNRFLAGRLAALDLAAAWFGEPTSSLALISTCPRCGVSGHGRPRLYRPGADGAPGDALAEFSLSRAAGHALVALAPVGVSLGVDLVDPSDPAFDPERTGYVGTAVDWALAEARGKAEGTGLVGPPTASGGDAATDAGRARHELLGAVGPGLLAAVVVR